MSWLETTDEDQTAVHGLQTQAPLHFKLLSTLALALRIEPLLLRNARLQFTATADIELETEIWFSKMMHSRNAKSCMLRGGIARALVDQLATNPEAYQSAWDFVQTHTRHWSAQDQLEQELRLAARNKDSQQLQAGFQRILKSLVNTDDPATKRDICRWIKGAMPTLINQNQPISNTTHLLFQYTAAALGLPNDWGQTQDHNDQTMPEWLYRALPPAKEIDVGLQIREGILECLDPEAARHILTLKLPLPTPVRLTFNHQQNTRSESLWLGKTISIPHPVKTLDLQLLDGSRYQFTVADTELPESVKEEFTFTQKKLPMCPFEHLENPAEAEQITEISELTVKLLDKRYPSPQKILRGVHPKSHGCVKAKFKINSDLDTTWKIGLFNAPGKEFDAIIRFSNAAAMLAPDTDMNGGHGCRGMAIKVLNIGGDVILTDGDANNQDFLMINQPVFAFANTEDYLKLNRVLVQFNDDPSPFFKDIPEILDKLKNAPLDLTEADKRILRTAQIVQDIQNTPEEKDSNPLEMQYFSAAPFLFGPDRVMKFSVKPVNREEATKFPEQPAENYLRDALATTMKKDQDVIFSFMVQVRDKGDDLGIENASSLWDESEHPFVNIAEITIPAPQIDIHSPENLDHCENLTFTPWHSLLEHQPIGSINRLRKSVYQASANHRQTKRDVKK